MSHQVWLADEYLRRVRLASLRMGHAVHYLRAARNDLNCAGKGTRTTAGLPGEVLALQRLAELVLERVRAERLAAQEDARSKATNTQQEEVEA